MPFISIEGVDGSGKTTQVELVAMALKAAGYDVVRTKEPDGGHLGKAIRAILTTGRPASLSSVEELLLIGAARYDHVRSVIQPALAQGKWVVCDRFVDSTFAFQVHGGGAGRAMFEAVTAEVVGATMPDFTFILDLPAELAAGRRSARSEPGQPDPAESTRNFEVIRQGLLAAAKFDLKRCHVIAADRPVSDVTYEICSIIGISSSATNLTAGE